MINPNDPQENPDLVSDYAAPDQAPPFRAKAPPEEAAGQGAVRQAHEHRTSREESDLKQFANSPARNENLNRRASYEPAPQRYGGRGPSFGEAHKRPARYSIGSENSMEQSPIHNHARISGRNSGAPSPSWEGKNSNDGSHGTPGRSRLRPKGDESVNFISFSLCIFLFVDLFSFFFFFFFGLLKHLQPFFFFLIKHLSPSEVTCKQSLSTQAYIIDGLVFSL
jgi:hypothetical protein